MSRYSTEYIFKLNNDIKTHFPHLFPITDDMKYDHAGVSRLVMLDRYSQKDTDLTSLSVGDLVITVVKDDPKFPTRGIGFVKDISNVDEEVLIELEDEFRGALESDEEFSTGLVRRSFNKIEKPLEIFYEQIAKRVSFALSRNEKSEELREEWFSKFFFELKEMNFVPAGRVLYGAGSGTQVTYFNCFVMPFVQDSRQGISDHRKEVMEIMSRGGGVGTNGSTLRPRHSQAKGVGGRSSGAVSWLHDLSQLTHLVEQGGSRRGAQMIMMADWHPDIIEFIISKMQNPNILKFLIENNKNPLIVDAAKAKLKFTPLTPLERKMYEDMMDMVNRGGASFDDEIIDDINRKLLDGGTHTVHNPDFLTGANISVTLTDDFMEAVENDDYFELKFPDIDHYTGQDKEDYDAFWHEVGDVREWEKRGYAIKTYHKIKARDLWDLINVCATYSAEPGIFFIDNANKMTNAKAYGQQVVATNPCGEQPLAPYSVCNLAAVNLANVVDKDHAVVDYDKLKRIVRTGVRMQDNVIDSTPYFLEANEKQALGERRLGLGIMGLHDLLIWCKARYGSHKGNDLVDKVMETIALTAYEASIEIAKEKGSFPFLEDRDSFIKTGYMRKLPDSIKHDIKLYGIRNSHLLTIAPTGSTGTMVGVSTGLEPYFSFKYYRSGRLGKFIEVNAAIVDEYLSHHKDVDSNNLPETFIAAMELSPEEHADVQCIIQRWVDSSISKTVNAPRGYSVRQVEKVYERLYKGGAKGGTVYVDGSRESQVLSLTNDEDKEERVEQLDLGLKVKEVKLPKEQDDLNPPRTKHGKDIGTDVGNICPICLEGEVIDSGGCSTCSNCGAQLKCGL